MKVYIHKYGRSSVTDLKEDISYEKSHINKKNHRTFSDVLVVKNFEEDEGFKYNKASS